MNINWDEVAEEAEDTPAARLTEAFARVDDIRLLALVWLDKEDNISNGWGRTTKDDGGSLTVIGMLHTAIASLMDQQKEAADEETV